MEVIHTWVAEDVGGRTITKSLEVTIGALRHQADNSIMGTSAKGRLRCSLTGALVLLTLVTLAFPGLALPVSVEVQSDVSIHSDDQRANDSRNGNRGFLPVTGLGAMGILGIGLLLIVAGRLLKASGRVIEAGKTRA